LPRQASFLRAAGHWCVIRVDQGKCHNIGRYTHRVVISNNRLVSTDNSKVRFRWKNYRDGSARIIAVEPEPKNFRILAMNAANYPNITPIQGGISDRQTRASLVNAGDDPWAWETKESGETGDVAMFTIPELLADVPNARPMIVKIDIEGGEAEMFRSNVEWTPARPHWSYSRRTTGVSFGAGRFT
jgi:FkbM family methyltransferase